MTSTHLETALLALNVGLSPVPPLENGTKAPICSWKALQTRPVTRERVEEWYSNGRTGNGLVCGVGDLDCFEFDHPGTHKEYLEAAWAIGLGELVTRIRAGYEESTPGKGYHWLFRCPDVVGNTKLARRYKTEAEFNDNDLEAIEKAAANGREHKPIKTLIETRGQGGFVVTAPSCGKVHPTGGAYKLKSGGLDSIVTITRSERDQLWDLARTFDEMPDEAQPQTQAKSKAPIAGGKFPDRGKSPGDDYEERETWPGLLEPWGWKAVHRRADVTFWRRPGKDEGWSATTGHCKGLKVFSSSTPFSTEGTYTKFGAFTTLQFGGDFKACTKALAENGYGTWIDNDGTERQNPPPPGWKWSGRGEPSQANGPPPGNDGSSGGVKPIEATGSVSFVSTFPQVSPISVDLRPVPKLDERLLPDPFRSWIKDIAERACCPLDLPAVSALVSVASVVGRKFAIRPKRHDDWTVVPNLWGMGVLPPGWLKTHCLEEPKKPLARLELDARDKHAAALQDYAITEAVATAQTEAAKAALKERARKKNGVAATEAELRELASQALSKPALVPPTLRRYIINDATVEKLGELLAENPDGLLLYRDELMGFLKGLEKQGHEGDRAFYLEAWNGTGSYSYDRIGRGSLFIPSNTVSILGGIQPGKLAAYIRGAGSGENDDGLISRFQLAVYPDVDQPFINVDRWPDTQAKNRAYAVFTSLASLDPGSISATVDAVGEIPYLRFADDAQAFFDGWRIDLETKVRSSQEAANLTSHLSKYRSLMPSLALLFHLIEVVSGSASGLVSLTSAKRSAAWCQYLEEHARRIYQAAFDGDPEPAQRLAERLKASLPSPFKARDVLRKQWRGLATKEEVDRAVSLLEEHGWLVRQEIPTDPQSGGRPTEEFHVNPAILNGGVK